MTAGYYLLGVDPGPTVTGWSLLHTSDLLPVCCGVDDSLLAIQRGVTFSHEYAGLHVVVEMIEGRGMRVGADVFETCVVIGRWIDRMERRGIPIERMYRRTVKGHLGVGARGTDKDVCDELARRYASGVPNRGKGTMREPGPFHGMKSHAWQAHAVAVTYANLNP